MKKFVAILLAALMLMSLAIPAFAETLGGNDTAAGGWVINTEDPTVIPDEVKECMDKALEGLVGCTYEPVAYLASQVVAGTNYCVMCRCTVVTPDAPQSFVMMYLYHGVDGTNSILKIQEMSFDAQEEVVE